MRLEYRWTGTYDRGDGEADMEIDPPSCPERCGGDAYLDYCPGDCNSGEDPESEVWKCSDCDGMWNGYGHEIFPEDIPQE